MNIFQKNSICDRSDHGLMFGWWVNLDGDRIAALDYRTFDVDSQFWHVYSLTTSSPRFEEIGFDPDKWCDSRVTIQNRFATSFQQSGVLMAPRPGNLIALRSISVPDDVLQQAERDNESTVMEWSAPQKT